MDLEIHIELLWNKMNVYRKEPFLLHTLLSFSCRIKMLKGF